MKVNGNSNRGTVLITGADGFVGRVMCERMLAEGWKVRGSVRTLRNAANLSGDVVLFQTGHIGSDTGWSRALEGVDAVIHLAARAHVMDDKVIDPLREYRLVNVEGTKRLAEASLKARVTAFVYLSSIKVNGEQTHGAPFTEENPPLPQDPYGVSKHEAEEMLTRVASGTDMPVTIIRPPLVYGPYVKGNILRMLSWVNMGIPLPLRGINNRRSLIGVDNLADLIVRCLVSPQAKGELFVAADENIVSTPELIRHIAATLDRPARLYSFPLFFLRAGARVFGMKDAIDRLSGSLVIDTKKAKKILGWSAPFSLDDGLKKMAQWFKSEHIN